MVIIMQVFAVMVQRSQLTWATKLIFDSQHGPLHGLTAATLTTRC